MSRITPAITRSDMHKQTLKTNQKRNKKFVHPLPRSSFAWNFVIFSLSLSCYSVPARNRILLSTSDISVCALPPKLYFILLTASILLTSKCGRLDRNFFALNIFYSTNFRSPSLFSMCQRGALLYTWKKLYLSMETPICMGVIRFIIYLRLPFTNRQFHLFLAPLRKSCGHVINN